MAEQVWDRFLTDRDRQVFKAGGYAARAGFGKRPALLVVDVNYAFCGDKREPLLESVKRWRNSGGEDAWDALPVIQRLIACAREREVPVIYTTGTRRPDNWDRGSWQWKNVRSGDKLPGDGDEIMPQIAPGPRDIVIAKGKPSGFFGTQLQAYLNLLKADSLIVIGTATSGCVRATVTDAFSYNYRVAVVEDACFDRCQASHAVSLMDMSAKYADIVTSGEALDFLRSLPQGLFDLPSGRP
jgi:nicotinamidase-related amidase